MKNSSEKIVFFGSGPVAAKALENLVQTFEIEAVITKPAKSPNDPIAVLDVVKRLSLVAFTPADRAELDLLIDQNVIKSHLGVLIDYGIIVSKKVIDYFPLGIINSHFSLLPEWRGADPITFSILSGQSTTGVSLMLLNEGMDTGPIIDQKTLEIENKNSIELTAALIDLSSQMLNEDVPKYLTQKLIPGPQPVLVQPSYSRKLTKADGIIDWRKDAEQIEREIRAYINWPNSTTKIKNKDIIITQAHVVEDSGKPGDYIIKDGSLIFYAGNGALAIDRLKPVGKNEMAINDFLIGYRP